MLHHRLLRLVVSRRVSLVAGRLSGRLARRTLLGLPGLPGPAIVLGLWL
jgi:hypothetical protein